MKKSLCGFLGIFVMIGVSMSLLYMMHNMKYQFAVKTCVSEETAIKMAQAAGLGMAGETKYDTEEMIMQIVYQLARRSIVKVTVKDAAGSGIIWKIDDEIVIASNRHLLMRDIKAMVTFGGKETVPAEVLGYSQQYDIGFIRIGKEHVTDSILRDIYEAVPVLYETEPEEARISFGQSYSGKRILQAGAVLEKKDANFSIGSIKDLRFVPLFNTNVLETECYAKAGMSGGGVFDETGRFLGMISGGDVPEDAQVKEAELTYSIPPALIASEYENILNQDVQ